MLSGWTAAQTSALAVAIVALLGSIFSTVYTVHAQRSRALTESRVAAAAEEIERCIRQLSEFYRPLQKHRASSALLRGLLPDHPWRLVSHLRQTRHSKDAAFVDMILEEGDKIFEILKCHIVHHEDGPNRSDVRACFLLFMRHHVLLKEAWGHLGQDWNNPGATTEELESSDVPFPLNLDNCIAMEVEEIRTRLEALHRGLRQ